MTNSGQKSQEFRKMCNPLKLGWIVNIWHKHSNPMKTRKPDWVFPFPSFALRSVDLWECVCVCECFEPRKLSIIVECIQLKGIHQKDNRSPIKCEWCYFYSGLERPRSRIVSVFSRHKMGRLNSKLGTISEIVTVQHFSSVMKLQKALKFQIDI